jgi:hypothetical protein
MSPPGSKQCPVCGSPHDTYGGLAMHMVKMGDEAHAHVSSKDEGLEHLAYERVLPARNHGEERSMQPNGVDRSYA